MGGHTICPDGIVVNMLPWKRLALDEERNLLHRAGGGRVERRHRLSRRARPLGAGDAVEQFVLGRRLAKRQLPRLAIRPPADRLDRRVVSPAEGRRLHRPLQPHAEPRAVFAGAGRLRPARYHSGGRAARRAQRALSARAVRRAGRSVAGHAGGQDQGAARRRDGLCPHERRPRDVPRGDHPQRLRAGRGRGARAGRAGQRRAAAGRVPRLCR